MRGFVQTPPAIVDIMVAKLFSTRSPGPTDTLLEPGCGDGALIAGVLRWCDSRGIKPPKITGVEINPELVATARERFSDRHEVEVIERDFLITSFSPATFVIGNPPYVSITHLTEAEKESYRRDFFSAKGRFDLYILFFERALRLLEPDGTLVFITPEKFLYVHTASVLRKLLSRSRVSEVHFIAEDAFEGLVTYPTITTVRGTPAGPSTVCIMRDGSVTEFSFRDSGESIQPQLYYSGNLRSSLTLGSVCTRISAGVATGADDVFVHRLDEIPDALAIYAFPTISGRQLDGEFSGHPITDSMLIPYRDSSVLIDEACLGALRPFLEARREVLSSRTCARKKPWYAFHETPHLDQLLRPKLLCKDVTSTIRFWVDRVGSIVPRHSVYYLVPHDEWLLEPLCAYLNGPDAARWLKGHCQRAANGFIRLQSTILKQLPLPIDIGQQVGARIDLLHEPRAHYSKNTLRTPPRPEMDAK